MKLVVNQHKRGIRVIWSGRRAGDERFESSGKLHLKFGYIGFTCSRISDNESSPVGEEVVQARIIGKTDVRYVGIKFLGCS